MLHPLPPQQQSFQSHLTPHQLEALSIFLITSGDVGSRVLFRYPYPPCAMIQDRSDSTDPEMGAGHLKRHPLRHDLRPTSLRPPGLHVTEEGEVKTRAASEELSVRPFGRKSLLTESSLVNFPDEVIANLFAVNRDLCGDKFELKIDDVRFIGHPVVMDKTNEDDEGQPELMLLPSSSEHDHHCHLALLHVVLAASTNAHYSVVQCFHELAKLITNAIRYEERNSNYLSDQVKIMMDAFDEGIRRIKLSASPIHDGDADDEIEDVKSEAECGHVPDVQIESDELVKDNSQVAVQPQSEDNEKPAFPMDDSMDFSHRDCSSSLERSDGPSLVSSGSATKSSDNDSSRQTNDESCAIEIVDAPPSSPYDLVLARSPLAGELKKCLIDLNLDGLAKVHFNDWSEVTYCLPQKVHKQINSSLFVMSDAIHACLDNLRPYHCLLLLEDPSKILDTFPLIDSVSDCYRKVVQRASPIKNFKQLAADCDMAKQMIFRVAGQLIYWGKATIIYPLCRRNKYCISPYIPNPVSDELRDKFFATFMEAHSEVAPGEGVNCWALEQYLALFNAPIEIGQCFFQLGYRDVSLSSLSSHMSSTSSVETDQPSLRLVKIIVWCLQHHILMQLHLYVNLAFDDCVGCRLADPIGIKRDKCAQKKSRFQSNVIMNRTTSTLTLSPDEQLFDLDVVDVEEDEGDVEIGFVCPDGTSLMTLCDDNASETTTTTTSSSQHLTAATAKQTTAPSAVDSGDFEEAAFAADCGLANLVKGVFNESEASAIASCFNVDTVDSLDQITPDDRAILSLFVRLAPYFCGRYHLEEIMYHENVSRSQIGRVLERMHSVLLTFESEDVAVTMYFKQSIT